MPKLEFTLDPADIPALARLDGIRPSRSYPARTTWFDTPAQDLANAGLTLANTAGNWQLTTLHTPPIAPPPILATARRPSLLTANPALPDLTHLHQIACLDGTRQALRWTAPDHTPVALLLRHGPLATAARPGPDPLCRLQLDGNTPAIATLAAHLANAIRLRIPAASLAEQALGLAPPPRLGAPRIHHRQSVGDSLASIVAHLASVILHWSARILAAPRAPDPEPVHQMRVATRRLRSALSIYRPAAPALATLAVPLRICAARLGVAREWDVFLGGLGARLVRAFPDDRRCRAMMRAAASRRRAAYLELRAYLAGPDFRALAVTLACTAELRLWEDPQAPSEPLAQDTAVFAAHVLGRRLKRARAVGKTLADLPVPALHELRKDCKRLRYATEFFAPLFPLKRTGRFLARLSDLQEELGLLNDNAAVAGLMAQLGRLERSYAAGLAEGFSAAAATPARTRIEHAWRRFRNQRDFWKT